VQDRSHEKILAGGQRLCHRRRCAAWKTSPDLRPHWRVTGTPALLKVSRFGYDGKGQARVNTLDEARAAFREFGGQPCVLEGFVQLECEVSVVLARSDAGECVLFPVAENRHVNGILDISIVPAGVSEQLAEQGARRWRARWPSNWAMFGIMAVWNSSSPTAS